MNAETFCEHFATFADAPNGVEKHRELIFDLAANGRILCGITAEVVESESRLLGDVAEFVMGQAPPGNECNRSGIGTGFVKTGEFGPLYPDTVEWTTKPLKFAQRGDVLICVVGATVGKLNLAIDCAIGRSVAAIRPAECLGTRFLYYMLMPFVLKLRQASRGSAQGVIGKEDLRKVRIWVPSEVLQQRIVEKVDQLLGLCDELAARQAAQREKRQRLVGATLDRLVSPQTSRHLACRGGLTASAPLDSNTTGAKANEPPGQARWRVMQDDAHRLRNHFDQLFDTPTTIPELRQTILQLAVQGQLATQDPNDEPANVLLERIESARRRRNPKIERTDNSIGSEDDLVPIPDSWKWCRVEQLATVCLGGTPSRANAIYWDGEIPWVSSGEVANCRITHTKERITEAGLANSNAKMYPSNSVLIAMIGQGKTRGQSAILEIEACTNQNVAGLVFDSGNVDPEYIWHWALCEYARTRAGGRGGAQPALNGEIVRSLLVPLPPLAEQKRIVTKVTKLLSLCDALEAKLTQAESASTQLLSAAVHHLLQN